MPFFGTVQAGWGPGRLELCGVHSASDVSNVRSARRDGAQHHGGLDEMSNEHEPCHLIARWPVNALIPPGTPVCDEVVSRLPGVGVSTLARETGARDMPSRPPTPSRHLVVARAAFLRRWQVVQQLHRRLQALQRRENTIADWLKEAAVARRATHLALHVACIEALLTQLTQQCAGNEQSAAVIDEIERELLQLAKRQEWDGGKRQEEGVLASLRERFALYRCTQSVYWRYPMMRPRLEVCLAGVIEAAAWGELDDGALQLAPPALKQWVAARVMHHHTHARHPDKIRALPSRPEPDAMTWAVLLDLHRQLDGMAGHDNARQVLAQCDVMALLAQAHRLLPSTRWCVDKVGYLHLTALLQAFIVHAKCQLAQHHGHWGARRFKGSLGRVREGIEAYVRQLERDIAARERQLARLRGLA